MARVKSAVTKRNRHKKILKEAKGYYGHKHRGYKSAKEQVRKSKEYAFRDRKNRKREFRKLWIKRINIAARQYDISYSVLMNGLKQAKIEINRKMLAYLAVHDIDQFGTIVNEAKKALGLEITPRKEEPKVEKIVEKEEVKKEIKKDSSQEPKQEVKEEKQEVKEVEKKDEEPKEEVKEENEDKEEAEESKKEVSTK